MNELSYTPIKSPLRSRYSVYTDLKKLPLAPSQSIFYRLIIPGNHYSDFYHNKLVFSVLNFHIHRIIPGGGHGNPLQYSCLENTIDRGLIYWGQKSRTQLKRLSMHAHRYGSIQGAHLKTHSIRLCFLCQRIRMGNTSHANMSLFCTHGRHY